MKQPVGSDAPATRAEAPSAVAPRLWDQLSWEIAAVSILTFATLIVSLFRPGHTAGLLVCVAFVLVAPGYLVVDWCGALENEAAALRWSTIIVMSIAISILIGMILTWFEAFYPAIALPIESALVLFGLGYRLLRRIKQPLDG